MSSIKMGFYGYSGLSTEYAVDPYTDYKKQIVYLSDTINNLRKQLSEKEQEIKVLNECLVNTIIQESLPKIP